MVYLFIHSERGLVSLGHRSICLIDVMNFNFALEYLFIELYLSFSQVLLVVGILQGEVGPMISVMKIEMTRLESCSDVGGLHVPIQDIKEPVELPELYEDIGFRPLKVVILYGEQGKLYLQRFCLLITFISL